MIEANINDARNFLISVVEDKASNPRAVELATKMIALIGFARSNIEDLLILTNLLDREDLNIDLRSDLEALVKTAASTASSSAAKITTQTGSDLVAVYDGPTLEYDPKNKEEEIIKRQLVLKKDIKSEIDGNSINRFRCGLSVATDGEYVYFHNVDLGLVKMVATGDSAGTIVAKRRFKADYKCGLAYIQGKLILRENYSHTTNANGKQVPFLIVNPDDFEDVQDGENTEDPDPEQQLKTLQYTTNERRDRLIRRTALFSDGYYLYAITLRPADRNSKLTLFLDHNLPLLYRFNFK